MGKKLNVQILRVVACLIVFIVHFGQRVGAGPFKPFTEFGQYGVQLFFVISGYLAFVTLKKDNSINLGLYFKKRAIRLLPLYFVILIFYAITEHLIWKNIPPDELGLGWLRYIFLLNGITGSRTYFWGNLGITWTIPIFAMFYLIAPFLVKIIKSVAGAGVLFIVLYALGFVCGRYCQFGPTETISYFNGITSLKYFSLGIIAFFLAKGSREYVGALLLSIMTIMFIIVNDKAMAYSLLFTIILLVSNKIDFSRMPNRLKKTIEILDEYSYTLYLGHGIVFCGFIDKMGMPRYANALIAIFGTLIVVFILRKFIEKPIQQFLNRIFIERQGREIK